MNQEDTNKTTASPEETSGGVAGTHTPGPWEVGPDGFELTIYPRHPNPEHAGFKAAIHKPAIADVFGGRVECHANARLIAAAPALLKALQRALPYLQEYCILNRNAEDFGDRLALDDAEKAIAAAQAQGDRV